MQISGLTHSVYKEGLGIVHFQPSLVLTVNFLIIRVQIKMICLYHCNSSKTWFWELEMHEIKKGLGLNGKKGIT